MHVLLPFLMHSALSGQLHRPFGGRERECRWCAGSLLSSMYDADPPVVQVSARISSLALPSTIIT